MAFSGGKEFVAKPQGILCYICGKEYESASIEMHLKTCKNNWEDEEEKKPVDERRPLPRPPKKFDEMEIKGLSSKDIHALNREALKRFYEESLVPCPNCKRTFFPHRLAAHSKSCKPGKTTAPVESSAHD